MAGGWASLGLLDTMVQTVEEDFDWILPTAVQDECIPLILGGGDVMASAETGSGKTAAFALPIVQLCHEHKVEQKRAGDGGGGGGATRKPNKSSKADRTPPRYEMSSKDRDLPISIEPNSKNLILQSRNPKAWAGCRCTAGVSASSRQRNYYYECTMQDTGIVRVGWSTSDASLNLGTDKEGYGYGGTGMKVHGGKYEPYPDENNENSSFSRGDVVGCHLDLGSEDMSATISFSKNGVHLGTAFEITANKRKGLCLFPAVCVKNAECELNFGAKDFRHLPSGYHSVASAGEHGIANPHESQFLEAGRGPMAIVLEPTRDLAQQTYRTFADLAIHISSPEVQPALLVGGVDPQSTLTKLENDQVDVLVGTPPIISSYMKKRKIHGSRCRMFVLDEADELIGTDMVKHINAIYSRLLASRGTESSSAFDRLQVCFFSATLQSKEVRALAETICHRPIWVDFRGKNDSSVPDSVHHCIVSVNPAAYNGMKPGLEVKTDATHKEGKLDAKIDLSKLSPDEANSERIKLLKPQIILELIDKFEMDQVLLFCRTNLDCDLMEKFIKKAGGGGISNKYTCRVLAGKRSMQEREKSLKDFKEGEARILIATDVAARGIDIQELPFVINATLPDVPETYVHRSGRVGRAERMGLAISIVAEVKEKVWYCRSGKQPPCKDCRLYLEGGNCKWYDEPAYLKKIEQLLKANKVSITKLKWPELNIPAEMGALLKGGSYGTFAGSSTVDPEMEDKMNALSAKVRELSVTEFALQSQFWKMKDRFKVAGSPK